MFDKNKILMGGKARKLDPPIDFVGLESLYITESGDVYLNTKLDLDTDGPALPGVRMDIDHQNLTALKNPDGSSINAFEIPYVVVPLGFLDWLATQGVHIALGAIAVVQYNGRCVYAIVVDLGPRRKIGEGSPALHLALGFNRVEDGHVIDCGIDSGVRWVIFAGSGNGEGRTLAEINAVGAELAKRL